VNPPESDRLSLWDGVSVVIGIVVGVSLFKVPALVFGSVEGPVAGLLVWAAGGAISFIGCSSPISPRSTSCSAAAAVIALVMDAMRNTVSRLIGGRSPGPRLPKAPL